MSAFDDLAADVAGVVQESLRGFTPRIVTEKKIVRDPISGFEFLLPHEVAIVDSPLFQRLRHIHQTALAYQVYPGAHHTRFEHSLGVAHRAQQMAQAINDKHPGSVSDSEILELRLAGLLHDIGHGPFSHLSESIFSEQFSAELAAIQMSDPKFRGRGLGEILSFLIVTSDPFKSFTAEVFATHHLPAPDLDKIAHYFLGTSVRPEHRFLAEVISGPFDADKLDYFHRDCYYTGIRAEIDIERILSVIDIDNRSAAPERHLVIRRAGVHHMEHIIFSKMLLFSSVYHHHKIRALECALRAIFQKIWANPLAIQNAQLRFPNIASMLTLTDPGFWVAARNEPAVAALVSGMFERRELPMRALALNIATIDQGATSDPRYVKYQELGEFPEKQRKISRTIYQTLDRAHQDSTFGVWFDFPRTPPVSSDAKKTIVDRGDEYVPLKQFFPSDEWVATYSDNKLTAHVFYDPDVSKRRAVAERAREYFQDEYGLVCKDLAISTCFKDEYAGA